jgi:hypothetical protein
MLAADAQAEGPTGGKSDYGGEATARAADYRISLTAATRWVNVNNGDTVQFEAGGKEFTWHFRTFKGAKIFNLALIAPTGMAVGAVRVFVAQNVFEMD